MEQVDRTGTVEKKRPRGRPKGTRKILKNQHLISYYIKKDPKKNEV